MKPALTLAILSITATALLYITPAPARAQDTPQTAQQTPPPSKTTPTQKSTKSPKSPKTDRPAKPQKTTDTTLFEPHEYKKDNLTLPYRILYPANMKPGQQYPLFLFLHGLGMRGTDNLKQLDRGAFLFVDPKNREQYPCIALYPQVPDSKTGSFSWLYDKQNQQYPGTFAEYSRLLEANKYPPTVKISPYGEMVMDLINQLIARGIVDIKRIYISGSSMGGFSTFQFITAYPNLFAAAAPIASSMNPDDTAPWLGKIPIWIIHGDGDRPPTLAANPKIVAKLKAMGYTDYKYTIYPKTGHNSWDKAFAEPDYMKWFFDHKKP